MGSLAAIRNALRSLIPLATPRTVAATTRRAPAMWCRWSVATLQSSRRTDGCAPQSATATMDKQKYAAVSFSSSRSRQRQQRDRDDDDRDEDQRMSVRHAPLASFDMRPLAHRHMCTSSHKI
jgi:hypothetical protein